MLNSYRLLAIPLLATTIVIAAPAQAEPMMTTNDKPQQWDDFFTFKRGGARPAPVPMVDVTGSLPVDFLDPRDRTWMAREEIRRRSEDHS